MGRVVGRVVSRGESCGESWCVVGCGGESWWVGVSGGLRTDESSGERSGVLVSLVACWWRRWGVGWCVLCRRVCR